MDDSKEGHWNSFLKILYLFWGFPPDVWQRLVVMIRDRRLDQERPSAIHRGRMAVGSLKFNEFAAVFVGEGVGDVSGVLEGSWVF